jgi:uncharacterized protein YhbP (UPF0306 family)
MTGDVKDSLRQLVETQRTLVLATADPDPWAAPVYYVRHGDRLYFFSGPRSRHLKAALGARHCAGAIYRDSDDWQDIEGLQMEGRVEPVATGPAALGAFRAYVGKFPTVRGFFAGAPLDLGAFKERFRSDLYAFVPRQVCYLNNRLGFSTRRSVQWPP